jgi:hypothetical protein
VREGRFIRWCYDGPVVASLVRFLWVLVGAPLWWGPLWVFVLCNEFLHLCPPPPPPNFSIM